MLQLGVYPLANIFLNLGILTLSPTLNLPYSNITSIGFILIVLCLVLLYSLTASSKTS